MSLAQPIDEQLHAQYLLNAQGEQEFVVLRIEEYRELLEELEDLKDVAERKANPEFVSLEEVKANLGL